MAHVMWALGSILWTLTGILIGDYLQAIGWVCVTLYAISNMVREQ